MHEDSKNKKMNAGGAKRKQGVQEIKKTDWATNGAGARGTKGSESGPSDLIKRR